MFQPLRSLLDGALQRKSIRDGVRAAVVIDAAREALDMLFPPRIASRMQATVFREGVLVITVQSAATAQEVRLQSAPFIALMNERFGKPVVRRIWITLARQAPHDMLG